MIQKAADGHACASFQIIPLEQGIGDQMFLEAYPEKVKAPERPQGSVLRRLNFNYMNGHGTFYRFDEEHFPEHLLKAETGDHVSVVLYNLHTDQLDEVVFKLEERYDAGEKCIYLRGPIDDIKRLLCN